MESSTPPISSDSGSNNSNNNHHHPMNTIAQDPLALPTESPSGGGGGGLYSNNNSNGSSGGSTSAANETASNQARAHDLCGNGGGGGGNLTSSSVTTQSNSSNNNNNNSSSSLSDKENLIDGTINNNGAIYSNDITTIKHEESNSLTSDERRMQYDSNQIANNYSSSDPRKLNNHHQPLPPHHLHHQHSLQHQHHMAMHLSQQQQQQLHLHQQQQQQQPPHEPPHHKSFSHSIENLSKTTEKCASNDMKMYPNLIDGGHEYDDGYETGVSDLMSHKYKLPSLPPPSSSPYSSLSSSSMSTISTATMTPTNLVNPQQQQQQQQQSSSPSYMSGGGNGGGNGSGSSGAIAGNGNAGSMNHYHQQQQQAQAHVQYQQQQQHQQQQQQQYQAMQQQQHPNHMNSFNYHHPMFRMHQQQQQQPPPHPQQQQQQQLANVIKNESPSSLTPVDNDPYRFVDDDLSNGMGGAGQGLHGAMHQNHQQQQQQHMSSPAMSSNYSASSSPMPSHMQQQGPAGNASLLQFNEHHMSPHHMNHVNYMSHQQHIQSQHNLMNGNVHENSGHGGMNAGGMMMMNDTPKKRGRKKKIRDENGNPIEDIRPTKERKKHDRFNGMPEEEVTKRIIPDHLTNNLDIVIVGINPGLFAAYKGHHYAGPGNHFWKCLYLSGLTSVQMTAEEDYKLLHCGIGFTNMVQRPTKGSADLTRKEIKEGSRILMEKIQKFQPKIAVFNGKLIFEVFSGKKDFCFGKQPETVEGTNTYMWVMPSSSARCAQLPRAADKVPFYAALKKFRDYLNGLVVEYDESDYVFNDPKYNQISTEAELKDDALAFTTLETGEIVAMETHKKKRGRPKKIRGENGEEIVPTPRRKPPAEHHDGAEEDPSKKKRGRPKKNKDGVSTPSTNARKRGANKDKQQPSPLNSGNELSSMSMHHHHSSSPILQNPQMSSLSNNIGSNSNTGSSSTPSSSFLPPIDSPSSIGYPNGAINHPQQQQQASLQTQSPVAHCFPSANQIVEHTQVSQPEISPHQQTTYQRQASAQQQMYNTNTPEIAGDAITSPVNAVPSPNLVPSDFEPPQASVQNTSDLDPFSQQQQQQQSANNSSLEPHSQSPLSQTLYPHPLSHHHHHHQQQQQQQLHPHVHQQQQQQQQSMTQMMGGNNNNNSPVYSPYSRQPPLPPQQQQQQQQQAPPPQSFMSHQQSPHHHTQQQQQQQQQQQPPPSVPTQNNPVNTNKSIGQPPPPPAQQQQQQINGNAPTGDMFKDVATKSLSGLESLVDQIPNINEQDTGLGALANAQNVQHQLNDYSNASSMLSGYSPSGTPAASNLTPVSSALGSASLLPPAIGAPHPHYPYTSHAGAPTQSPYSANPFSVSSLTSSNYPSAAAAMNSYHQNLMGTSHLTSSFMEPHMPVPVTPLYHSYQQQGYPGYPAPPHHHPSAAAAALHMSNYPYYTNTGYTQAPGSTYHSMFDRINF